MKSKGRVLVVDNNPDVLISVGHFLKTNGYSVLTTDSPQQALKLNQEEIVHLAIIDVRLTDDYSETDWEGDPRPLDCDLDGTAITDMVWTTSIATFIYSLSSKTTEPTCVTGQPCDTSPRTSLSTTQRGRRGLFSTPANAGDHSQPDVTAACQIAHPAL